MNVTSKWHNQPVTKSLATLGVLEYLRAVPLSLALIRAYGQQFGR